MTNGTGSGLPGLVQSYPKSTLTLLIALAVLVLVMIFAPLSFTEGKLLDKLADIEYARGVITFIFAIGTIGIAIILTIAALQSDQDAAARFNRGKEVFTILVGIFGTIIGFYFGTVQVKGTEEKVLEITEFAVTVRGEGEARELAVEAEIEGGSPTYVYTISFDPESAGKTIEGESDGGDISESAPLVAATSGQVTVTIEVSDEGGGTAERSEKVDVAAVPAPGVTSFDGVPAVQRSPGEERLAGEAELTPVMVTLPMGDIESTQRV